MVILLYGEDQYRLRRKINEIIERYQKTNRNGLSIRHFDLREKDFGDFNDEIQMLSMFREQKLIILENTSSNKEFEEKFLKDIKEFSNSKEIIIFSEGGKIPEDRFFLTLKKYADSQAFDFLDSRGLRAWAKKEFKRYNTEIGDSALDKLIEFTGNDLWRLDNEIKKLVSYRNKKEILLKDVENLVKPEIESDIFKTIDAIAQKNKNLALKLIHKHLEKGDSPYYLFSMINFQFRNLLMVKSQLQSGNYFPRIYDLSRKLGMHPFVVEKTVRQTKKFSLEELRKIYKKIFKTDIYIKTGRIESQVALDLFLAEI